MAMFALDPSRGSILKVLIQTPGFIERIKFGGTVGYTIIVLGLLAGFLAIVRWVVVFLTGRKVAAQKKSDQVSDTNPLGRVLGVYESNREADVETLELKLDEVILRESASLDKLLWAVKVVSVVAPLMGLLGTVTGMIRTFQAITLFGTGDPKMMASGISEALVTTMLGLYVAIPLVLLHALVSNTSKGGGDVLLLIAAVTFLMWTLMLERLWYFKVLQPREARRVEEVWRARNDHESWFADQARRLLVSEVRLELHHSVGAIKTLVAICPMLGLLGTVTGMIEVFDVMAISGSGNTRAMASGVSKATIPTMAGMVAALSGMILSVQIERFANRETERVADHLTHAHE
jgi:biopolymer transport protein ExbB/TolQ